MTTDSFIVYIKTDDTYKDIAEDDEIDLILQIMNQIDHCLKQKIKKAIGLMKDDVEKLVKL